MKDITVELYGEQWTGGDVDRATREVNDCMKALAIIQQNMDHSNSLFRELFKHEMQNTLTHGGYTSGDTRVESEIITWQNLPTFMQHKVNSLYNAIDALDEGCMAQDLYYPLKG